MYLYETHCHCSNCSACAVSTPAEMVAAYAAAGYAGLVLTDHFIFGNTSVDRELPWDKRMQAYYDAFLEAKEAARDLDFDVIFGFEHHYGYGKEVLVYGVELDFLLQNPDIPELSLEELTRRIHSRGGVVIQAHPYRDRWYIDMAVEPQETVIDGVEVFNACSDPGEDLKALELAKRHPEYILTSGGDIHSSQDSRIGSAGVWLTHRVADSAAFAAALKQRQHHYQVKHRKEPKFRRAQLKG